MLCYCLSIQQQELEPEGFVKLSNFAQSVCHMFYAKISQSTQRDSTLSPHASLGDCGEQAEAGSVFAIIFAKPPSLGPPEFGPTLASQRLAMPPQSSVASGLGTGATKPQLQSRE